MFVRFECGCVGIVTDSHVIIIEACFYDGDPDLNPRFEYREREGFSGTNSPLSQDEIKELVLKIGGLVKEGRRFRELKSLLK